MPAAAVQPDPQSVIRSDRAARLAEARRRHGGGDLTGAVALYRGLVAEIGDNAEIGQLLGIALHQAGDPAAGLVELDRALALKPDLAAAWQNRVLPLLALGRFDEAAASGLRALEIEPEKRGARTNAILALIRLGDLDRATAIAETALATDPDHAETLAQFGHIRQLRGDHDGALLLFDRALARDPRHAEAHYNRGVALQALRRDAEAAAAYRRVLALEAGHRGARLNLGVALRSLGDVAGALAIWDAVAGPWEERDYNRACALMLRGDWAAAWGQYEHRFAVTKPVGYPPPTSARRWDGTAMPGGRLVVLHEQGLGDTIQFLPLLAMVAERVGSLVFRCQPVLAPLLAASPLVAALKGTLTITADSGPWPDHDAWAPLLSLAGILGLARAPLPLAGAWLAAEPERVARWGRVLDGFTPGKKPFRIGLNWQGNPAAPVERGRSLPLAAFAPLKDVPGALLVALQKGPGSEQMPPEGLTLHRLGADFDASGGAFLDTVAVLKGLDLVITSDTSMAHVAAALGRPVWLLLKHVPDWRWGLSGVLVPHYPGLRLFRQKQPGDWDGVMAEVAAALGELAALRGEGGVVADAGAVLAEAIALHGQGRIAAALDRYRLLLAGGHVTSGVLNGFGMALAETDNRSAPVTRQALTFLIHAVGLGGTADVLSNLGVLFKRLGLNDDARTAFLQALARDADFAPASVNLISLDIATGDATAALARARAVSIRQPNRADAFVARADAAKAAGEMVEAEAALNRAILLEPKDARHRVALGALLDGLDRPLEAARAWDEALALNPMNADALSNLGVHERKHGLSGLGLYFARAAVAADPGHVDAWSNLGIVAGERDRHDEAEAAFARAVALKPTHAEARMALGMAALTAGRFKDGWADYEWRLKSARLGLDMVPGKLPLWTGGDLTGKRILVMAEQGFGDALHFVRYAALLKAAGAARVVIGCRQRLKAILATAPGVDATLGEGEKLPPLDCYVPMMSLPQRFGTDLASIPAAAPYLAAEPDRVTRWAARLMAAPEREGLRVGLIWQGNPDPQVDRGRSIPLARFAPLAAIPGLRLIALQKGPGSEQLETAGLPIETLGPDFDSGPDAFLDSAAVMMSLDLVITTDTAIAHLAGALGRPTWLLIRNRPEWRWLTGRGDSVWYPSLRLWRQSPADNEAAPLPDPDGARWRGPISRLAAALARLASGDRAVLHQRPPEQFAPLPPPPAPATRFALAHARHRAGDLDAAARAYADLLADLPVPDRAPEPLFGETLAMLGALFLQRSQPARALYLLGAAARAGCQTPERLTNEGIALRQLGRLDEAAAALAGVMAQSPSAEAALALANIHRDCDRREEALALAQRAVALGPRQGKAQRSLGNVLKDLGRCEEAIAAFDASLKLENDPAAALDRAHALLAAGRLREGFAAYEARWSSGELQPHGVTLPQWDGRSFVGKTLFVHGEQGLGDQIQFARFIAPALARGGSVVLMVRRMLFGIMTALGLPEDRVRLVAQEDFVAGGEAFLAALGADLQIPMLSLPHVLGDVLDGLGRDVPYLRADPARVALWRDRLGPVPPGTRRFGLIWQGNPAAKADRGRSPPLARLMPALDQPGLQFVALQKEHGLEQVAELPGFGARLIRPGPDFDAGPEAFLDTMAVMAGLNGVVTSDTAAAHLAGALGVRTYLLLKAAPDWRWQHHRADSLWYPSLQLIRQTAPGDWVGVAAALKSALAGAP